MFFENLESAYNFYDFNHAEQGSTARGYNTNRGRIAAGDGAFNSKPMIPVLEVMDIATSKSEF